MDKSKLIDKHLKGNYVIIHGNVHHFIVTGEVKGAFKGVLIEMLQEFEDSIRTTNEVEVNALIMPEITTLLPDTCIHEGSGKKICYEFNKCKICTKIK